MTISNNTLQSTLLSSSSTSLEGEFMSPPMKGDLDMSGGTMSAPEDNDFWAMLSQQSLGSGLDESPQVSDYNEFIDLLNQSGQSLEAAEKGAAIPQQWMQFLKSHFKEEESAGEGDSKLSLDNEHASANAVESATNLLQPTAVDQGEGENLPPLRQALSTPIGHQGVAAAIPAQAAETEDLSLRDERLPVSTATASRVKEGEQSVVELKAVEVEFESSRRNNEQIVEKMIGRQPVTEQGPVAARLADGLQNVSGTSAPTALFSLNNPAGSAPAQTLPPALQTLPLSPSQPAAQWGQAIGERVSFLINHKLNNAEIRIDPPHLGKLDIQVQVREDSAVIMIQTHNAQTRDLIDQAGLRLRDILQEAGYNSVDVNVSHREQSSAEEQLSHNGGQSAGAEDSAQLAVDEGDGQMRGVEMILPDSGRIDFFA